MENHFEKVVFVFFLVEWNVVRIAKNLTQYFKIFKGICATSQSLKRGIIGGISGYGTSPPLFSFFKKPQMVLAWAVLGFDNDGLTRRKNRFDGLKKK